MHELTVDQPELARIFGVSVRTVQRWGPHGLDDARTDDSTTSVRYDLPAAVAWRVAHEAQRVAEAAGSGTAVDIDAAKARKELALAELREIEVAERRGELLPVDLFRSRLVSAFMRVVSHLDAIPSRWTPPLAACDDREELRAQLNALVRELREGLAREADAIEREAAQGEEEDEGAAA